MAEFKDSFIKRILSNLARKPRLNTQVATLVVLGMLFGSLMALTKDLSQNEEEKGIIIPTSAADPIFTSFADMSPGDTVTLVYDIYYQGTLSTVACDGGEKIRYYKWTSEQNITKQTDGSLTINETFADIEFWYTVENDSNLIVNQSDNFPSPLENGWDQNFPYSTTSMTVNARDISLFINRSGQVDLSISEKRDKTLKYDELSIATKEFTGTKTFQTRGFTA
jgi:hypothetical protein